MGMSDYTRPSLYRDFALLSVIIVMLLLLVSVWIVFKTYQSHSRDILQQLENESVRIDRALIIEIEQASYLLESIGRQIDVNRDDINGQALRLLESFSGNQPLKGSEFYWINAKQQLLIGGHGGYLEKPIDISDRDYMKRVLTTPWKIHIGKPVEGRVSSEWVIPVAMGITSEENEFLGAIMISLNIEALSRVISGVIKHPQIDFAITNTAFTLLTQMSDDPDFFARYFSLSRLSDIDFEQEPSGVFSLASWFERDNIYATYERSSQYPYIIFVGYDPHTSRSEIDELLIPRLVQIGIMSSFFILTLWIVRKRIIQPAMKLTENTRRILRGQPFEHDSRHDPIEIEQLAEVIRSLSAYIEERRRIESELAAKNARLMKVKEAAETTNHLKARFFKQVGEALMQPARSIIEYVESLRNELFGPLGNEKYLELSESIHEQGESIVETLDDIRAISEAETGLLALDESAVDINFIIKKAVRLIRETGPFQSNEIICDLDEEIPKIRADELRMKQLMLNVLTCTAYEIEPHDTIRLSSALSGDGVRIELTFKPIPHQAGRQDAPPYASASQSDMRAPQGGFIKLGNALSELIIAMHGGELTTKALPDHLVKRVIVIPSERLINATAQPEVSL